MSNQPYRGAARAQLEELHAKLAKVMLDTFAEAEAEGRPLSAHFLFVVRAFLRDNHINAAETRDLRQGLEQLRALSLPFTGKETKQ